MTTKEKEKLLLFTDLFPEQLKDWIKERKAEGKPASQNVFAKEVGVPAYYVTDWKTGRSGIPYLYIDKICEVLGVDREVYCPKSKKDKYEKSSRYITSIGKEHVEFAKEINLNLDLLEALSKVVDFDELFPLYSPIDHRVNLGVYDRKVNFINSAVMGRDKDIDKDLKFLQIERDKKRITFHRCDLAFLKEVQDQIVTFVEYLFYRREKEKAEEVDAFNRDLFDQSLIEITVDGEPVPDSEREKYLKECNDNPMCFLSGEEFKKARKYALNKASGKKVSITVRDIPEDFVLKHDRFAKYFWKISPDNSEKKEATQEDWDQLHEGDVALEDGVKATKKKVKNNG